MYDSHSHQNLNEEGSNTLLIPKKSVLALAVAAACHANAQENSVEAIANQDKFPEMEEVVVFGQFQQSLINRIAITPGELPFTLSVLDREFLDARNFTRPIEALTTLPNVFRTEDRQGTGGTQFLSRGFDAPILVDNRVQNNFRGAGARDDAFVERYEVLKGPASIASGPVGGGGIINILTKSPHAERSTDLKLRADQFGTAGGEFDVNLGNLSESNSALFRVTGAYRNFQFDADEVERKTVAIRPVTIFNIGQATSVKASIAYTKHDVTPASGFPLLQNGDIPDGIDTDTFAGYANSDGEVRDTLANLEVNHEFLDNLKLTVRGSKQKTDFDYQNTSGLYNYAGDPGLAGMYGFPQTAATESEATFVDAQLAYSTDFWGQDHSFVVGVANDKRSFDRLFNTYTYDGPYSLANIDQPRFGDGGSGPLLPFTLFDSKLKSVFAEGVLRPTDRITVVGGIRYDRLEQLILNFRRGREIRAPFDDSEVTARIGVSLEASDNLNVYASYAQAFVPQFGLRRNNSAVEAETSDSVEVGVKGSAFNGAMTFESGLFRTLRKDVALNDPDNVPGEAFVVSAGEIRVQGLEFSTVIRPTPALNIVFNIGYTDIDVVKAGSDEIAAPVFPELTASFYLDYKIQSGALEGLSVGGGVRHVGEREGPRVDWDSHSITDLNFGYTISEGLDLSLDILNVTDEKYVENTSTNTVNRLSGAAVLGAPLTAAFTLNWSI